MNSVMLFGKIDPDPPDGIIGAGGNHRFGVLRLGVPEQIGIVVEFRIPQNDRHLPLADRQPIVFGHGRKYLAALIEIEADTVADWARSHDVPYTGFTSLASNAEVARLIGIEVERANGELSRPEQIKAFRILPKALDPEEEGEPITPTRKVKRHLMYERFKGLVEEMYDDREQRLIAAGAVEVV